MCNIKSQLFDEPPSAPHRKACIEQQSRGLCLGMIIEGWSSLIKITWAPDFPSFQNEGTEPQLYCLQLGTEREYEEVVTHIQQGPGTLPTPG